MITDEEYNECYNKFKQRLISFGKKFGCVIDIELCKRDIDSFLREDYKKNLIMILLMKLLMNLLINLSKK